MITVTTANVCGNPIRAKAVVRARMTAALSRTGVVFAQEVAASNRFRVGGGDYSTLWHRIAAAHHKVTEGGPREVPISLPARHWQLLTQDTVKVHDGLARVSPARYLTSVVARREVTGEVVGFVNAHTVSKPRPGVNHAAWRMARWDEYQAAMVTTVAELIGTCDAVVFGGDLNRVHVPPIHPDQSRLIASGLDHLWIVTRPGWSARVMRTRVQPRTLLMDHPILTATFALVRPSSG